jgi:hypothetical protein
MTKGLLILLAAGLLSVACGETTAAPPSASPIAKSPRAPVVVSGLGDVSKVIHLEAGSYNVSWQSPDKKLFAFCGSCGASRDPFSNGHTDSRYTDCALCPSDQRDYLETESPGVPVSCPVTER